MPQLAEEITEGGLLTLTGSRHSVEVLEDSVLLLATVSGPPEGSSPAA